MIVISNPTIFPAAGFVFAIVLNVFLCLGLPAVIFSQDDEDEVDVSIEAVALFNQGQDAHEKGDLPGAVGFYEKALVIIPDFPEAELQRGNAFRSLGRIDDAERAFRRAVEIRGEWTLALANLGSVLVSKGLNTEAEPILTKAIALDDLNFPAYAAITELRLNTKAKPEVLRELLEKLKILTNNAKPTASMWASRGGLENALGERKAARISFENALKLDPQNQFALAEKADTALEAEDITRADETVKLLEKIAPKSANTKALRARILFARGNTADAISLLNSIEKPSADIVSIRDKIIVGGSENAAELEKELTKDQSNPVILGRLCSLLRIENPSKSLNFCRRASEADPNNLSHAVGYGAALVQAKLYTDAVNLFRRLLIAAPDNSTIRANLATALFQLKRYSEAKAEYQSIIEKQPSLTAAYYFLALTHDHLGEYLDAVANYQQFLRIADPQKNKLEIEKVNLRLPGLLKLIGNKKGKNR